MRKHTSPGIVSLMATWVATLWLGARCRCPKCKKGQMFRSFFYIHKKCPECGVTFQPYEGDSLGVYAVCYVLAIIPAILGFVAAFKYTHLEAMGLLGVFAAISGGVLFGFYRNMKGIWVALVYLMTGLRPQL